MSAGRSLATTLLVLALSSGSATLAAQRAGDTIPASVGDLNAAQLVEIRDDSGQVLLHGTLKTSTNTPKETERKAELVSPTGQKAKGTVDVDIERKDGVVVKDEVEVSMERLPSMAQFELFIDGKHVTSFMTTKAGKAELKLERKATN